MRPAYKGFWLNRFVQVTVPSTSKKNHHLSKKEFNKRIVQVEKVMGKRYGGFTAIRAEGGYVGSSGKIKGKLVREPVEIVQSFATPETFNRYKNATRRQTKSWGRRWGQESMAVTLGNAGEQSGMYLLFPSQRRRKK